MHGLDRSTEPGMGRRFRATLRLRAEPSSCSMCRQSRSETDIIWTPPIPATLIDFSSCRSLTHRTSATCLTCPAWIQISPASRPLPPPTCLPPASTAWLPLSPPPLPALPAPPSPPYPSARHSIRHPSYCPLWHFPCTSNRG